MIVRADSFIKVTTESGSQYLVHKGPNYGKPSQTVVTDAQHMSSKWTVSVRITSLFIFKVIIFYFSLNLKIQGVSVDILLDILLKLEVLTTASWEITVLMAQIE